MRIAARNRPSQGLETSSSLWAFTKRMQIEPPKPASARQAVTATNRSTPRARLDRGGRLR